MTSAALLLHGPDVLLAVMTALLAPLALRLAAVPRCLVRAALVGGALAAGALALAPGPLAAMATLPYALVCWSAGAIGLVRVFARPVPASQLATQVGLVALAGAAVWLVAYRAGYSLLDYPPLWVALTAAHFHVAGAFLAIVVGWVAHERGKLAAAVAIGCVAGVPLTAAGIAGPHVLEVAAALVMAASGFGAAVLLATTPRLPIRISGALLALGMVLAAGYALRDHGLAIAFAGLDPLASMIASHALLDTAFAALALGTLATAPPRVMPPPPLSRLAGAFPVGATYFARAGLERPVVAVRGLVDDLHQLDHAGLDAGNVRSAIRTFYEQTGAQELIVKPRWRFGFRTGARLWAALARRTGQLQLPVHAESGREGITSRVVSLDEHADGRRGPRAWIRTYPDGRALYVAAYATHARDGVRYMNIAFPLPGGNLSSVLRMDHHGTGVRVSTRVGGDAGIWFVLRVGRWSVPFRLPLSEHVDVWAADDPAAPGELVVWGAGYTTVARHELWLFGIHYLTLEYAMRPSVQRDGSSK